MSSTYTIPFGKEYTRKLRELVPANWTNIGNDIYTRPYWAAHIEPGQNGRVAIIVQQALSSLVYYLPNLDAFYQWRKNRYAYDPETGRWK